MMPLSKLGGALALAFAALAAAPATSADTFYSYTSEPGDYIGAGQSKVYTSVDSQIGVRGNAEALTMSVSKGSDSWRATLAAPRGQKLQPGRYYFAERSSFRTGRSPGIDIGGNGRGCNQTWGTLNILQIESNPAGEISKLEAVVYQRCERDNAPQLTAVLRYNANSLSLSLDSDSGDYIGQGIKKSYAGDTSTFLLQGTKQSLTYSASGQRDDWMALIRPPTGQSLQVGTYQIASSASATHASFDFFGNGRGCGGITGTLTVRAIEADPATNQVVKLHADFEQRCQGGAAALRGTIRFQS